MANLYITVFEGAGNTAAGDPIQEQRVVFSDPAANSSPIPDYGNRRRHVCRILADGDCFVTWGSSPTAKGDGTDGRAISEGVAEYFSVEGGHQFSVIQRV